MSRHSDRRAEVAPLSRSDEARARVLLAAPPAGLDDLELAKSFLAGALALIDQLRTDRDENVSAPTPPLSDINSPSPFADLIASAIPKPGHTWSDLDVAFELRMAQDSEHTAAQAGATSEHTHAWRAHAAWHRARAAKMSHLVEASDADAGWFLAEHLLATKTRPVSFHGGPFDGHERTIVDPPRTMWIAHRPIGRALDQAYLLREIAEPHDPIAPPRPEPPVSGGSVVGWYAWNDARDRFEWWPVSPYPHANS